ncbi:ABC transporter substrate-binding protein [Oceanospirillum sediminis]|uniref:ABC transporter substrate-binding protein n=1 Tax=Oceanospirillum sediminis TaxID=2760088 RepID=A0A839IVX2_9GAMM|nr:ABC transporter substrate-binding protein [Oceanospirillum sediminis]MBB1488246.1 ABC transporter substrate-binding protein [Oceanospirillum sediminis]
MSLKKALAAATLVAATVSAPFAMAADKVRIATEGAYAPFNFIDESGKLKGFDVDIANALCEKMKADCTIVAQDWDGIIPGLMARKYDAVIASMSITPERSRVVDFSEPYYSNSLIFVAPKSSKFSPKSVDGKVIGAQRATIAGQYLEDNLADKVTVKLYDTQDNAYLDLASGRLDAIVSDQLPAYDWLRSEDGQAFEFKGEKIDIDDKIGIAIRKNDKLREKMNKALQDILADGTYDRINAKYFPFSIY